MCVTNNAQLPVSFLPDEYIHRGVLQCIEQHHFTIIIEFKIIQP